MAVCGSLAEIQVDRSSPFSPGVSKEPLVSMGNLSVFHCFRRSGGRTVTSLPEDSSLKPNRDAWRTVEG